jgi:hypothetical protein
MTPVLLTSQRTSTQASPALILSASLVRDAAEALAEEALESSEASRYHLVADRLNTALGSPRVDRRRLLMTSPALTERSGRTRTLVEMIEADECDDAYRFRLAKLLFRALPWQPETFPIPTH